MAGKHPYISSSVALIQVLDYLRKSFPNTFNSETLKKLSFAPGNESYLLNIMRFLGFVDETDARTDIAHRIFTLHDDGEFQGAFSDAIKSAYSDLFSLHGDNTWELADKSLIPYFRQNDKTTELVGTRQASTFRTLSTYAGHSAANNQRMPQKDAKLSIKKASAALGRAPKLPPASEIKVSGATSVETQGQSGASGNNRGDIGLTVRIEINLPATGDQDTYDKIFKSIRENFLNV